MRAGYFFLASFGLLPLAGWPLLAHRSYRALSPGSRIALAGCAGGIFIGFWMTVVALAGFSWRVPVLFLLAVATSLFLRLLLASETVAGRRTEGERHSRFSQLGMLLSSLAVLWALLATVAGAATSADLLLFWGPKAEAFASARTIDAKFLGNPLLDYMHTSYPTLVPNLYAFATMLAGRFPWGAATLTFPLFLAALAVGLPGALRLVAPRSAAWACSALVTSALGLIGREAWVAGNADPALWLFEGLAAALLVGPAALTRGGQLLGGLLLAGAAATKVEGLPFAAITGLLFLILRRKEIRVRSSLVFLLFPTVLSVGTWFAFGVSRHLFLGYRGYGRVSEVQWNRLLPVLAGVGEAMWSVSFALPFLLPLLALLVAPSKSRLALLPAGVALALALFFLFAYLHSDPNPQQWIAWSAVRIFSPLVGLLTIASAARAGSDGPAA